jgi:predicted nuclease of predicted toxin-antitoxin system
VARLYADENFPRPAVDALRKAGHDVRTLQDAGYGSQGVDDDEVLAMATAEGRAVLTLNRRHFLRLHREKPDHGGVIVCTFDLDFVGQATRIDAAIQSIGTLGGQLIRINRGDR